MLNYLSQLQVRRIPNYLSKLQVRRTPNYSSKLTNYLSQLPIEVLEIIAKQLIRNKNFVALASTSKGLRSILSEIYKKRENFRNLLRQMNRTNLHYNTGKYKKLAHGMHRLYPNNNMTTYYKTQINKHEKNIQSLNEKTLKNSLKFMLVKNNGKNTKRLHYKTGWGYEGPIIASNIIIGPNGRLKIKNH